MRCLMIAPFILTADDFERTAKQLDRFNDAQKAHLLIGLVDIAPRVRPSERILFDRAAGSLRPLYEELPGIREHSQSWLRFLEGSE